MKRKQLLLIGSIVVIALGVASVAFGALPTKIMGSLKIFDGMIYSEQDQMSKKQIADSIDPVTGKPTEEFTVRTGELRKDNSLEVSNIQNRKSIEFNMDGKKATLNYYFVKSGQKNVVLPNSEENYQLTSIPNSGQYVMDYNGSIYQLDIESSKLTKILSDNVKEYEYSTLKSKKVEGLPLIWGERPHFSPNGEYMIYYSNRNAVKDGKGNGQLWMKGLKDNIEEPVYDGGFEFAGWGQSNEVFIRDGSNLVEINLEERSSRVVQENISPEAMVAYPYIISPELGEINLSRVDSKDTRSIHGVGRADMLLVDPSGQHIAIKNYPAPESFDNNILILDSVGTSETFKTIYPEDGYIIDTISWINTDNILVVTIKKGTIEQYSYIVNIKEIN